MRRRLRLHLKADEQAREATAARAQVRHLALPERALGPVAGTALLLFVWAGVAHASGSGWVQTVGAAVAGLAFVAADDAARARVRASLHARALQVVGGAAYLNFPGQ